MYLWLQIFLLATGITARLIISSNIAGSGLNLSIDIFIWLAFLIHLLDKSRLSEETSTLPSFLKALLLLFVALIITSFINAPYKFGAFQYLVAWISDIVLFYLVFSLCVRDTKYSTTLLSAFLSTALIVLFYALYQHFWELRGLVAQIQQNPLLLDMIPVDLRDDFLARARAAEPFATFTYQNSLGAFLALIIPLFIALVLIRQKRWWIALIISLIALFIMVKTGSKGAIVSLILVSTAAIYYFIRLSKLSLKQYLLAAILIFLLLLIFIVHSQMSSSFNARLGYWDATVKIIRDNPWNGVGLNQFGNSYLYYKSAIAGEVTKAHNDYLQIAAEMGIPALIVFLAIWFIILKSIFRPPRAITAKDCLPNTPRTLDPPQGVNGFSLSKNPERVNYVRGLPCILGVGFAFMISELFQTPLIAFDIPFLSTIILFILWIFVFRFFSGYLTINILNSNMLRIGLFAGLVAFLIHCFVDFNFYVQGLSMSIWFIGAVFLSTTDLTLITGQQTIVRTGRLKNLIRPLFILLTVFILLILCIVTSRLIRYESLLEQGKTFVRSDNKEERSSAIDFLKNAYHLNPYAVDPLLELAWAYHYNYCLPAPRPNDRKVGQADKAGLTSIDNIISNNHCLEYIHNAIKLSPLSSMLYYQEGFLYQQHADYLNKICSDFGADPEKRKAFEKIVDLYRQRAILSFKMTQELYPTFNPKR
ncbi:MAG: O-antigen ligase family protein [Planctomycetota bacterium]